MDFGLFREKLRECNPRIYVDMNHRVFSTNAELGTSGIYLKDYNSGQIDTSKLSGDTLSIAEKYNTSPDEYIGWVTHGYVPEVDEFQLETGKPISRGWRTIVSYFVKKGYIEKKKAEQVFGWYQSDYDKMSYDQRLELARKHDNSDHGLHA